MSYNQLLIYQHSCLLCIPTKIKHKLDFVALYSLIFLLCSSLFFSNNSTTVSNNVLQFGLYWDEEGLKGWTGGNFLNWHWTKHIYKLLKHRFSHWELSHRSTSLFTLYVSAGVL